MALVSLKEVLSDSKQKKYGVFATNAFSFEMAEIIVEAAEEKNSPIILMIAEELFKFINPEKTSVAIISMIKDVKVPIVFHLDHGNNFDAVMRCIRCGFNSIMFDGSMLSLEENTKIVKELKRICTPLNICIEAEVGYVRGLETDLKTEGNKNINTDDYTKVEDAVRFVDETKVDALAIAVGTIHGRFRSKPNLDFNRIKEIRNAVDTPLVLHGSSGLTDKDFRKAINSGITKINYFTDLVTEATKKTKEIVCKNNNFSYMTLNKTVMGSMKNNIKKCLDLFGSTGKA